MSANTNITISSPLLPQKRVHSQTVVPAKDFAIEPSPIGPESNVFSRGSNDDSTIEYVLKGRKIELKPTEEVSVRPFLSRPSASTGIADSQIIQSNKSKFLFLI